MNKKILITIAIILIVGIAGFFVVKNVCNTPEQNKTYAASIRIDTDFLIDSTDYNDPNYQPMGAILEGKLILSIDAESIKNICEVNNNSDFEVVVDIFDNNRIVTATSIRQYTYKHTEDVDNNNVEYVLEGTLGFHLIPKSDGGYTIESDDVFSISPKIYYTQISIVLNDVKYVSNYAGFYYHYSNDYTINFFFTENV